MPKTLHYHASDGSQKVRWNSLIARGAALLRIGHQQYYYLDCNHACAQTTIAFIDTYQTIFTLCCTIILSRDIQVYTCYVRLWILNLHFFFSISILAQQRTQKQQYNMHANETYVPIGLTLFLMTNCTVYFLNSQN